jgi:hypothetical protein
MNHLYNKPKFILQIALATSELDELIDGGPTDLDGFIHEFRNFNWAGEVSREFWSRKSTPALGVANQGNGSTFWTSAWDWLSLLNRSTPTHEPALSFIVGLNNGPKPPNIYCRKEDRNLTNLQFTAESPEVVESLFALYLSDRYNELYRELFKLSAVEF